MRHPTVHETILLMMEAHRGQRDKSGAPYWQHPFRVMIRLSPLDSEVLAHTALLHDVVEDTGYGIEDLEDLGYSREVLDAVSIVSRDRDGRDRSRTHQEWIEWIRDSGNMAAILVKYADLLDNHAPGRIATLPAVHRGIASRQTHAIETLRPAIARNYLAAIPHGDIEIPNEYYSLTAVA